MTCDFQQCGILTSVDSDKPVQPTFKGIYFVIYGIISEISDKGQFQYLTNLKGPQEGTYLYTTQFLSLIPLFHTGPESHELTRIDKYLDSWLNRTLN